MPFSIRKKEAFALCLGNTAIRDREGKIEFLLGKKRKLALMLAFFYKELSSDRQGLCKKT